MKLKCSSCHVEFYDHSLTWYRGHRYCAICLAAQMAKRNKHNPCLQMQARNQRVGLYQRPVRSTCR